MKSFKQFVVEEEELDEAIFTNPQTFDIVQKTISGTQKIVSTVPTGQSTIALFLMVASLGYVAYKAGSSEKGQETIKSIWSKLKERWKRLTKADRKIAQEWFEASPLLGEYKDLKRQLELVGPKGKLRGDEAKAYKKLRADAIKIVRAISQAAIKDQEAGKMSKDVKWLIIDLMKISGVKI